MVYTWRESIPRLFNGGRTIWPPAVPRLAAGASQSNPRGSGPEELKGERGHVTSEIWSFGGGGLQGPSSLMEPPTMLLVPICRDMQLWWDKPPIPSPRNCMPGDTCFDDLGRNCVCVTWTQMYVTLQTKKCFPFKSSHYSFFFNQPLC